MNFFPSTYDNFRTKVFKSLEISGELPIRCEKAAKGLNPGIFC
jgi:hypothetical protein